MDQLDLGVRVAAPLVDREQPGLDQPVQHPAGLRGQPVQDGGASQPPPGAVRSDQAQHQVPGGPGLGRAQTREHRLGVIRQGAAHAADGPVGCRPQQPPLPVPPIPDHPRGELKQRQTGGLSPDLGQHLAHQLGVVVAVPGRLHRAGEDLLQRRLDRAPQDRHVAQGLPGLRADGQPAQEVVAQGEDHPHGGLGIVRRGADRLHEGPALVLVLHQGVDLLQLIDQQQDPAALGVGDLLQRQVQPPGGPAQDGRELLGIVITRGGHGRRVCSPGPLARAQAGGGLQPRELDRGRGVGADRGRPPAAEGALGALPGQEPGGQGPEGIGARAEREHGPRALLAEPRDDARLHEGALASPRGSHHGQHRLGPQAFQEAGDLRVPAEEVAGVPLRERLEAPEGPLLLDQPLPPGNEEGLEDLDHLRGRGAVLRLLLQTAEHQVGQVTRDLLQGCGGGDGLGAADPDRQARGLGLAPRVRPLARDGLVEHHTQGPDIGGAGDVGVLPLLGGHVHRRAAEPVALGAEGVRGVVVLLAIRGVHVRVGAIVLAGVEDLGQAEVHHPYASVPGDEHVLRLQVPVQHPVVVGLGQGLGHRQPHPGHLPGARPLPGEPLSQVLPLQVLERHIGVSGVLSHGVDRDDVGVREAGGGAGLEQEALDRLLGADPARVHHLERHLATQAHVAGQEDLAHPPPADGAEHAEVVDLGPDGDAALVDLLPGVLPRGTGRRGPGLGRAVHGGPHADGRARVAERPLPPSSSSRPVVVVHRATPGEGVRPSAAGPVPGRSYRCGAMRGGLWYVGSAQ